MSSRVALYLQETSHLPQMVDQVRYAEARGFEAIWQAERIPFYDGLTTLGAYAAVTSQIKLGAAVVTPWSRDPELTTSTLITLDALAPDRIQIGIGINDTHASTTINSRRDRPLLAIRNTVSALREQLSNAAKSGILRRVAIYLGATGTKTCALAGEIADGVLLNYLISPEYTARAIESIAHGAQIGRRAFDTIDRAQVIIVSLDFDRHRAFDRIRPLVAQYLGTQPALMRACDIPPDLLEELSQLLEAKRGLTDKTAIAEVIDQAAAIVPDSVIQQIAAVGTPSEVRAGVEQYIAAGCTCPVLAAPGGDLKLLIDTFATR